MLSGAILLLQLDHASDLPSTERAAECGVDAVMADGSKLSFRDNLAFTAEVVRAVRPRGIGWRLNSAGWRIRKTERARRWWAK